MLLYSMEGCCWCDILKTRLDHGNFNYEEINDETIIRDKGFPTVPRLQIDDNIILDFEQAIYWINEQESAAGEVHD